MFQVPWPKTAGEWRRRGGSARAPELSFHSAIIRAATAQVRSPSLTRQTVAADGRPRRGVLGRHRGNSRPVRLGRVPTIRTVMPANVSVEVRNPRYRFDFGPEFRDRPVQLNATGKSPANCLPGKPVSKGLIAADDPDDEPWGGRRGDLQRQLQGTRRRQRLRWRRARISAGRMRAGQAPHRRTGAASSCLIGT